MKGKKNTPKYRRGRRKSNVLSEVLGYGVHVFVSSPAEVHENDLVGGEFLGHLEFQRRKKGTRKIK